MTDTHLWEVYLMFDDGHWESVFFRAPTEKAIEGVLIQTAEYRKLVNFKIENADHEDLPDSVRVRSIE